MMDSSPQTEENVADPFAADIFAAKQNLGETAPETSPPPDARWTRLLKKSNTAVIDWSALLNALPPDFSAGLPAHLSDALRNLLALPAENGVELLPLVTREINCAADFPHASGHSWWLRVFIEPDEAEFAVEIDDAFAVWLVDAMLGEKISDRINWRELTETETSVLEYLSLNLISEANRAVRAPLFKIRSFKSETPVWLDEMRRNFTAADALLVASWQTVHGLLPSIVRIYLAPRALENLSAANNSLLNHAPRPNGRRRLPNHIQDARARLPLGRIDLTLAELASLEPGDVALLASNNLTIFGGNLFGRAEIFLGDGENLKISGEILAPDASAPERFEENALEVDNKILVKSFSANQTWKFVVTDLAETENQPEYGQTMTETDENTSGEAGAEAAGGGNGLAVENLALTLRVELDARRLTLAEIADLRENQILELGVRPTDAVNLLIENRVVGRGELVEIEERLGVRITKLLR